MTTTPRDPLTDFTAATRTHAEEVFATRVPDFAAMLARARELDPNLVSEAETRQAETLAPVIPIQRGHRDRSDHDALAPFTAATRALLAAQTRAPPRPAPPPLRPRRRLTAITVALTALAAILLIWQGPRMARLLAPQTIGAMAVDDNHADPPQPLHDAPPPRRTTPPPQPAPEPEPAPAPPTPEPAPNPAPTHATRPHRPPAPPLEDEAQALWQRGELAAAEQKLREVVRRAGKSARAELAYGDLFALAGQMRGPAGQTALAREYLAAFPSGRFADDMRAGLCQRAPVDDRPPCWRDYLTHHPGGAHRRSAEAALAEAPQ
jgi:outer membrane biosynthesis protein TonB